VECPLTVTGGIFNLLKQRAKKKDVHCRGEHGGGDEIIIVVVACHRRRKLQRKMTPGGGLSLV